jgi:dimeric dUTPase (all-alpha-NTP-PPase superfamily)
MPEAQNTATTANLGESDDFFTHLMCRQAIIQEMMGNLGRIDQPEFLREQALALIVEVSEALQEMPWKSWKRGQVAKIVKFRDELVDVQIFLCNLLLIAKIDPQEFMHLCMAKQQVNIQRQQENY